MAANRTGLTIFVRVTAVGLLLSVFAVSIAQPATAAAATYYVAPDGNDTNQGTEQMPWQTVQKAAETLNPGDTVLIKNGTYNEKVVVTRSGSSGLPILFKNYPGHTPVIDTTGLGGWPTGGIFEIRDCSYIRLVGLNMFNGVALHTSGIWVLNADELTIENCHTYNTTSTGIKISNSRNVVLNSNEVEMACQSGGEESITIKLNSENILVINNHIHHTNHEGIDIKEGSRNVQVAGNYIHHVERQGLYTDAWNLPTYNIEFSGNIIHDCGFGLGACAEQGGLLSNVWFYNNLVYNCEGPGMFVADWGGGSSHPIQDVYYINNTVHNCGWSWGGGMFFDTAEASNVVVRNNIFSAMSSMPIILNKEPVSKTIDHNLSNTLNGAQPGWCILGQAMFADASAGNFHLQGGSDAIDAGTSTEAPASDLDGDTRPQAGGFDIGAYEGPWGDIDSDGYVNFIDFAILAGQWYQAPGYPSADLAPYGGDGMVDFLDLDEFTGCWPK